MTEWEIEFTRNQEQAEAAIATMAKTLCAYRQALLDGNMPNSLVIELVKEAQQILMQGRRSEG